MVSDAEQDQPRRSGRSRKSVVKFSVPTTQSRRTKQKKHAVRETEEEAMELDDTSDDPDASEPSSEDDFQAPRRAQKAIGVPSKARSQIKPGALKRSKGRKRKTRADEEEGNAEDHEDELQRGGHNTAAASTHKDYTIATDNDLFEAVRHDAALELTVDDWIASYQRGKDEEAKGIPLAQLINFSIRCCGCSESLDEHEVLDLDAAVDKSEEVQDIFKRVPQAAYPLVAKSKQLKKFRKSLSEFVTRLVEHTHTSGILYDDLFCQTFQTWLVAATSSRLRSFRHTATVIVLEFMSALCSVAVDIEKAFQKASRQKENEENKSRTDQRRLKQFEDSTNELHEQKVQVEGYLAELLSSVFVHRYRDAEPSIRLEATRSLGQWMEIYPSHFLQGSHLRYLGWVLTDSHKDVRLEAVKVLDSLYAEPENIGMLQLFTERFKSRFLEMASCEPEMLIRRRAISILESVDRHGLLESDQQAQLISLVFHIDAKVRRAVAPYVVSRVEDEVQELIESGAKGRGDSQKEDRDRLWCKCLARLLLEQSQRLDAELGVDPPADPQDTQGPSQLATTAALHDLATTAPSTGRFATALEAVWTASHDLPVCRWEALAKFLLLDHSSSRSQQSQADSNSDAQFEEHQVLDDAEESVLLELLTASIGQTRHDADLAAKKLSHKEHDPDVVADMTRSLMQLLPKLLEKHQTRPDRLASLMKIPMSMRLELYLDMRMVTAYEELWNLVVKHFLGEVKKATVESAFHTLVHLHQCGPLRETNESKLQDCVASLCSDIRDLSEELDVTSSTFSSEQIRLFSAAMFRLHLLLSRFDISAAINNNGNSSYASVVSVVDALVDRGCACPATEDQAVNYAISVSFGRLLWLVRSLKMGDPDTAPDQSDIDACVSVRDEVIKKLADLAIGQQSNPPEEVRRSAFVYLLNTLMLMHNLGGTWPGGRARNEALLPLRLTCDDELQYRCAGFIEAEIQGLLSIKDAEQRLREDSEDPTSSQPGSATRTLQPKPSQLLSTEHSIRSVLGTFVGAVLSEVFDKRHASVMLPYYRRCDVFVDECCRKLVEKLKDDGLYNDADTSALVGVLVSALKDALDNSMSVHHSDEDDLVELAKLCASATTVYKGIVVTKRLPSESLAKLHSDVFRHALDKLSRLDAEDQSVEQRKSAGIFNALAVMLRNVTPCEAQLIQTHLQETLSSLELQPDDSDLWDSERAYERRLNSAIARLEGAKRPAKPRGSSPKAGGLNDEETADVGVQPRKSALKQRPAPKPRSSTPETGAEERSDPEGGTPPATTAAPNESITDETEVTSLSASQKRRYQSADDSLQDEGESSEATSDTNPDRKRLRRS